MPLDTTTAKPLHRLVAEDSLAFISGIREDEVKKRTTSDNQRESKSKSWCGQNDVKIIGKADDERTGTA
ncbi:uncharacterized protein PG998_008919 [Apiospora kogelbergensis]|uniref:Uncharacterized protein n=1 Tax=Apiospora kogelbergensis TaxID=1337665 RepID=A0AAW0R6G1_9PEZI